MVTSSIRNISESRSKLDHRCCKQKQKNQPITMWVLGTSNRRRLQRFSLHRAEATESQAASVQLLPIPLMTDNRFKIMLISLKWPAEIISKVNKNFMGTCQIFLRRQLSPTIEKDRKTNFENLARWVDITFFFDASLLVNKNVRGLSNTPKPLRIVKGSWRIVKPEVDSRRIRIPEVNLQET